jgi:hypothetical protein
MHRSTTRVDEPAQLRTVADQFAHAPLKRRQTIRW